MQREAEKMSTHDNTWSGIPRNRIQWFPTIDHNKCNSCMACIRKCKHGVYVERGGKPKVIAPENCIVGCTGCQAVCPQNAISHPPESYLEGLSNGKGVTTGCQCRGG